MGQDGDQNRQQCSVGTRLVIREAPLSQMLRPIGRPRKPAYFCVVALASNLTQYDLYPLLHV